MKKILLLLLGIAFLANQSHAQEMKAVPLNWHMLDYSTDSVYGISADKAYADLLKNKTSQKVIVGIVDAGADTAQEDLRNVIWHNPKEILGDGIDNDKDGYIDDYYGWNFLGGKNDTVNVTKDSYVADRVYFRYKPLFENVKNLRQVKKKNRALYDQWLKARTIELTLSPQYKEAKSLHSLAALLPRISDFKQLMLKDSFTLEDVKTYDPIDRKTSAEKQIYSILFSKVAAGTNNIELPVALKKLEDSLIVATGLPTTPPPNYRADIVKDNYNNFKDKYYGNGNINAGDVMHGTHVSGIIGAERNNGLGMDGIADNVALMELRAVPDGDEHDKDIALAIRFAVDHGAKVINMSFGKALSPNRQWVEDAIKYAQKHDVLLVHAAGNDGVDMTDNPNFPTQFYGKNDSKSFDNMITVGASGAMRGDLVAEFSNFGAKSVDVFAPGVQIYSTLPGKNSYGQLSGTSMASPVVSGVAAVIRSYFPKLTAPQVKQIIMQSVTKIDFPVTNPATGKEVPMKSLCISGGIVNLYNAIKLAEKMSN
ncbi:S8 family serine peptidase [Arachidicoccus soli]|uniref:Peptidase S8 n=1 Tax=Arachidicoccus soli TaxID=2341117 RepID=A0A386HLW7_9BACT|nr:S8 family serine peptidase [Arachidicoccus soli]AYD46616.1 peptidase S8 [Arachidicoccus soli]